MGRFRILLAVLLLWGSLMQPGMSSPVGTPSRELAGTTVLAGSTSGMSRVHLSQPVEISSFPFRNDFDKISSQGRIAGFVLKQDLAKGGVEVLGLSLALCDKPPCKERRLSFTQVWDPSERGFPEKVTLPAGDYFLYLIADGPTHVELSFPGLSGRGAMEPESAGDVDITTPETTFEPVSGRNIYAAEAKQILDGIGWAVLAYEVVTEAAIYSETETCLQSKKRDGLSSIVTVPLLLSSCRGSGSGSYYFDPGGVGGRQVVVSLSTVDEGRYFHSIASKTVGEVKELHALALDISVPRGKRTGGYSAGVFYYGN